MTVTNGLCTQGSLKAYLGLQAGDPSRDVLLDDAINAASRAIEDYCGRHFYDAGSATARTFAPDDRYVIDVDDFSTTTGLVIKTDANDDGTFEITWTSSDYELDTTVAGGITGWPYRHIRAVGDYLFPLPTATTARRFTVQVTARWGWAAVPEPVRQATLQVAAKLYRRKDAPFGVSAVGDFGPLRISSDSVRAVSAMLSPYVKTPVRFA